MTRRRAFTLLELAVAAVIGTVVLGLAFSLLSRAHRAIESGGDRLARRESARQALTRLRALLTDATAVSIFDGSRIIVESAAGQATVRLDGRTRRLLVVPNDLLAAGVESLHVTQPRPGVIRIQLAFATAPRRPHLVVDDEVLVPSLAPVAAAQSLPLRPELSGAAEPPSAASMLP